MSSLRRRSTSMIDGSRWLTAASQCCCWLWLITYWYVGSIYWPPAKWRAVEFCSYLWVQNFRNLMNFRGGVKILGRNPQKAHPCLISRILSHRSCKSVHGFFAPGMCTKKGHYKKSQSLYFTYLRGIPRPTMFMYVCVFVCVCAECQARLDCFCQELVSHRTWKGSVSSHLLLFHFELLV